MKDRLQDEIFRDDEADAWFARNRAALADPARLAGDLPLELIAQYLGTPRTAVEVGCADGWRLEELHRRTGARCIGVEPSAAALEAAHARGTTLDLRQGLADALPVDDASADLVILAFVLHWIDRRRLLRVVAEIDRILVDGGHLVIWDFLPVHPSRTRYHHRPDDEVFTYKQDYAGIWLASGLYRRAALLTTEYHTGRRVTDQSPQDTMGCSLLRKDLRQGYVDAVR